MISWAGHDAQFINKICPSVMLFVPSKNGKSHCEEEETTWEECEQGANMLLETLLSLLKDKQRLFE
ncbi:M20/M25/M40 family metallo-hydrolase [Halalkalibacter kiskunsagensis]|uniref:M20/M25/M40 family metallo-hydrolase n=1 Tax=Halalkalibacter kiskunsagensis TaxID=1548599 RepID=A0ABV6KIY9_9BACI